MRKAFAFFAFAFGLCFPAHLSADSPPSESRYAQCPGHEVLKEATQVSWDGKIDSALPKHQELRKALNAPMPNGRTRILMYWSGGDLATTRLSLVAVRNANGVWHTNEVGDSVIWIKGAKPTLVTPTDRDLSVEDSRRVDQLLADPCLNAGPSFLGRPAVGAGYTTLEVETPTRHWRAGWSGTFTPQEEELAHLVGPKS